MSRIERTYRARVDAQQIWVYVAQRNYPAADRLVERFDAAIKQLADNPQMGEAVDHTLRGVRRFTVGSYVLLFEPLTDGVRVLRIVHSSRDLKALMREGWQ
jgi:toxin ParE1/3/4